jgi:hypothetical protein
MNHRARDSVRGANRQKLSGQDYMKTLYTIDPENNIMTHSEPPAHGISTEQFSTEKELGRLSADWPSSRLIEIWNSFAAVAPFDDLKPVKKFTTRAVAVERIWKAVQRLTPAEAAQVPAVATEERRSKKSSSRRAGGATARDGSKQ